MIDLSPPLAFLRGSEEEGEKSSVEMFSVKPKQKQKKDEDEYKAAEEKFSWWREV